ncbi:MAG: hypothetical protein WD269_02545 [Acidimicrobiia bacterium]
MRTGRWARVVLATLALSALATSLALPALAQDVTETTVPALGTTIPTAQIEPAVPVVSAPETPVTPDWTYRFMIPTALVLAALVVLLTSIRYFTNVVRKRYRIVEE